MTWWHWAIIGLGLLIFEMGTPGFFLVFFAAGAFFTAVLRGFLPESELWVQIICFAVVSTVSLLLFRNKLIQKFGMDKVAPSSVELVNEMATPLDDIAAGGTGRAQLRGTSWTAKNDSDSALAKGQRCKVTRVDGLTIWLKAE